MTKEEMMSALERVQQYQRMAAGTIDAFCIHSFSNSDGMWFSVWLNKDASDKKATSVMFNNWSKDLKNEFATLVHILEQWGAL